MQKVLLLLLMCIVLLTSAISSAMGSNNPELLRDMKVNEHKYVAYGGQSVGMVFYLDKTSVVIESDNEAETVLRVKNITYYSNGMLGNHFKDAAWYRNEGGARFAYNHQMHNVFEERYNNDKKQKEWVYLDPSIIGTITGYKSGWESSISAAEITYYIAFHKWFYGKRLSKGSLNNLD